MALCPKFLNENLSEKFSAEVELSKIDPWAAVTAVVPVRLHSLDTAFQYRFSGNRFLIKKSSLSVQARSGAGNCISRESLLGNEMSH
jgi:hypothetical protein